MSYLWSGKRDADSLAPRRNRSIEGHSSALLREWGSLGIGFCICSRGGNHTVQAHGGWSGWSRESDGLEALDWNLSLDQRKKCFSGISSLSYIHHSFGSQDEFELLSGPFAVDFVRSPKPIEDFVVLDKCLEIGVLDKLRLSWIEICCIITNPFGFIASGTNNAQVAVFYSGQRPFVLRKPEAVRGPWLQHENVHLHHHFGKASRNQGRDDGRIRGEIRPVQTRLRKAQNRPPKVRHHSLHEVSQATRESWRSRVVCIGQKCLRRGVWTWVRMILPIGLRGRERSNRAFRKSGFSEGNEGLRDILWTRDRLVKRKKSSTTQGNSWKSMPRNPALCTDCKFCSETNTPFLCCCSTASCWPF